MRNFLPRSRAFNERTMVKKQTSFENGAFDDLITIPNTAVKYAENYILFDDHATPRGGSKRISNTTLPVISGRTGYSLSKTGSTVTKTAGSDFTPFDIGNFIVHDSGLNDLIIGFTDRFTVTVNSSTVAAPSTNASVRGNVWQHEYHQTKEKIIIHIDYRVFITDKNISTWEEVAFYNERPANSRSYFIEFGSYFYMFNANGIFKIDLSYSPAIGYKINSSEPSVQVTQVSKSNLLPYGYRYLYCMSRISGAGITGDRTTTGAIIEQVSAPVKPNATENRDYGEVWLARPIGDTTSTYYKLSGGSLPAGYDTVAEWATISSGQFKISVNSEEQNIEVDFTGVESFAEIAERIQTAMLGYWDDITVEFSGGKFYFTNKEKNGTISVTSAGDGGTNIGDTSGGGSGALSCHTGSGTAAPLAYYTQHTVSELTIPVDVTTSQPAGHWTHYSIYRTQDIGEEGIANGTNSEAYVWVADIPIAKVGYATLAGDSGVVEIDYYPYPVFTQGDVGNTLTFSDGESFTITSKTSSKVIVVYLAIERGNKGGTMFKIGTGGTPLSASQVGSTLTITSGYSLTNADIGRPIFFMDGSSATIKSVEGASSATTYESQTITNQPAIINPTSRKFSDSITDEILTTRSAVWTLPNRLWTSLPNCDIGDIINGFIFCAKSGEKSIYYSQMASGKEYLSGYYRSDSQTDILKDRITFIIGLSELGAVWCSHSTYAYPMSSFSKITDSSGGVYFVITGRYEISQSIGTTDIGSISRISAYQALLRTNEPAFRVLYREGSLLKYTESVSHQRLDTKTKELNNISSSSYDNINGYIVWSSNSDKVIPDSLVTTDLEQWYEKLGDSDVINGCYVEVGTKYIIKKAATSNPFSSLSIGGLVSLYTGSFSESTDLYIISPGVNLGGGVWGIYAVASYDEIIYTNEAVSRYWWWNEEPVLQYSYLGQYFNKYDIWGTESLLATEDVVGYNVDTDTFYIFPTGLNGIGAGDLTYGLILTNLHAASWNTTVFVDGDDVEGEISGETATIRYVNYVGLDGNVVQGWYLYNPSGNFTDEFIFKVGTPAQRTELTDYSPTVKTIYAGSGGATICADYKDYRMNMSNNYETAYDDLTEHTNLKIVASGTDYGQYPEYYDKFKVEPSGLIIKEKF